MNQNKHIEKHIYISDFIPIRARFRWKREGFLELKRGIRDARTPIGSELVRKRFLLMFILFAPLQVHDWLYSIGAKRKVTQGALKGEAASQHW